MVLAPSLSHLMTPERRAELHAAGCFFRKLFGVTHLRQLCERAHADNDYRTVTDGEFDLFIKHTNMDAAPVAQKHEQEKKTASIEDSSDLIWDTASAHPNSSGRSSSSSSRRHQKRARTTTDSTMQMPQSPAASPASPAGAVGIGQAAPASAAAAAAAGTTVISLLSDSDDDEDENEADEEQQYQYQKAKKAMSDDEWVP